MKKHPSLSEIHELIRKLPVPPSTMPITPSMAAGYKLAKPVQVKGVIPERPVSLVDGLAVRTSDVLLGRPGKRAKAAADTQVRQPANYSGLELTAFIGVDEGLEPASGQADEVQEGSSNSVSLRIRKAPIAARKSDSLETGEAMPVTVGGEVPRGAQFIYPLAWIAGDPQENAELAQQEIAKNEAAPAGDSEATSEDEDRLPFADPGRSWDLPEKYSDGWVDLDRIAGPLPKTHVQIGDWARNREPLVPEGTVLRAGELALLNAAEVDEVVVHRRPVVGVASLAVPFPHAQRENARFNPNCPLTDLAVNLAKSSMVSSFSLGRAPGKFATLVKSVQHWLGQVDFLVLVGGSHHGPHCLGLDVLKALGEVQVQGADFCPGDNASFGMVGNKTLAVLPGSFADVLVSYVLMVRPLTHHSLAPPNFADTVKVGLNRGADLHQGRTMAYPVKLDYDHSKAAYCTAFNGKQGDEWLDYSRGQALVVAGEGRQFADGEVVEAFLY